MGNGPGLTPRTIGQSGGEATVTLLQSQLPSHSHVLKADSEAPTTNNPANNMLSTGINKQYANQPATIVLNSSSIGPSGGGQPHNNLQPYLVLNFCIALQGVFPARS